MPSPAKPSLLIVDDEAGLRDMLSILFRREGYEITTARGVVDAKRAIAASRPDVVLTDLMMPDGSGLDLVPVARAAGAEIIVMTAHSTLETAVSAMKLGAYDFVTKPFSNSELKALLAKALEKRALAQENVSLRARLDARSGVDFIGRSEAMKKIATLVARVGPTKSTILISGESGTGKERVARAVHRASERAQKPLLVVNCGAIPEALLESELFGHEKGSFTGASQKHDGIFRAAEGGSVFLDEVGELPLSMQVKLLRVLQERKVRPVGSSQEVEVDVRVIAATNRDLEAMVKERTFRDDLYYRLRVIPIHLPPLRERRDDIPPLTELFLKKAAIEHGRTALQLSSEVLRAFDGYAFPGNVRELENLIERAVTLSVSDIITVDDLPQEVAGALHTSAPPLQLPDGGCDLDAVLADLERTYIQQALTRATGIRAEAGELLGINLRSLRYRMKKLGLLAEGEDEAPSSNDLEAAKESLGSISPHDRARDSSRSPSSDKK